jgi:hypothetical protein
MGKKDLASEEISRFLPGVLHPYRQEAGAPGGATKEQPKN